MGLLDIVKGAMEGGDKGGENPLVDIVMQMISNPNTGGLEGLLKSFQNSGLGEQAASWVSTGANLPISADQIIKVLGADK